MKNTTITKPDFLASFDAMAHVEHVTNGIRKWFGENGPETDAVIGISGGKDSTIAAALLARALGPDRVFGVLMPEGKQSDLEDAKRVVSELGINAVCANVYDAVQAIYACMYDAVDPCDSKHKTIYPSTDARINTPPRIRMTLLYAYGASRPKGARVINTGNASENYVNYSTKHGDGAGDYAPLAEYTVSELKLMGHAMGLPYGLVEKAPADGLCGKTDEDNLGFPYEVLDRYLLTGECPDDLIREMIEHRHTAGLHKLRPMPTCPKLHG